MKEKTLRLVIGNGPGNKLELAAGRYGGKLEHIEWLSSGDNFKSLILLATGQAELVMKPEVLVSEVLDPIIRVNRSAKLVYPDWVIKVLYPELEDTGPKEYDGTKLGQFLLPDQVTGIVTGNQIHKYLKENKMLESCPGLRDLLAIKEKGIAFFRANFKKKAVVGWRSIVRSSYDNLRVPCLVVRGDEVVLNWSWLGGNFYASSPVWRFAS